MTHVRTHAPHVALMAVGLLVLGLADVELTATAVVVMMVACAAILGGGVWFIHRREARRTTTG